MFIQDKNTVKQYLFVSLQSLSGQNIIALVQEAKQKAIKSKYGRSILSSPSCWCANKHSHRAKSETKNCFH